MKRLLSLLTVMILVLAGCSSSAKEITFWNALTGPDGDYMTELVDQFNEEYDGEYHIEQTIIPNDDLYTKLAVAKSNMDNLPDMVLMDNVRIPQFVEAGILKPMDDVATQLGLSTDDYIPGTWETASYDGKLYGIPFDSFEHFLYYNEDILTELGYTEADLKDITVDKAITMAQEAIDAGYNGWGMFQEWPWSEVFLGYLYQAGGEISDSSNPDIPTINTPEAKEALEAFYAPYEAGVTDDPQIDPSVEFISGNTLFMYDGIWQTTAYITDNETANIGVSALPTLDGTQKMYAGTHNISVINKDYNEEQSDAISAFTKFLNDNSGPYSQAGQIPANMNTWDSEEFQNMPFSKIAEEEYENFVYAPQTQYFGVMFNEVLNMCKYLVDGTYSDVDTALETTQNNIEEQINQLKSEE